MPDDTRLREHLVHLLDWRDAHRSFDEVLGDWPAPLRGVKPTGAAHTAWELLEHLRLAQADILEFCRNPRYVEPPFPEGYWPQEAAPPAPSAWDASLARFRADLEALKGLVRDPNLDLYAPIPHGQGQTYLREILLVADHNAYHLGQLVLLRRLLGAWR